MLERPKCMCVCIPTVFRGFTDQRKTTEIIFAKAVLAVVVEAVQISLGLLCPILYGQESGCVENRVVQRFTDFSNAVGLLVFATSDTKWIEILGECLGYKLTLNVADGRHDFLQTRHQNLGQVVGYGFQGLSDILFERAVNSSTGFVLHHASQQWYRRHVVGIQRILRLVGNETRKRSASSYMINHRTAKKRAFAI